MQVAAVGIQVEDRVADELARTVIGRISTSPGLEEFDAQEASSILADQDMFGVCRGAECDDVGVLE